MPIKAKNAPLRSLGAMLCIALFVNACGSSGGGQDTFYLARTINLVTDSAGQTIEIGDLTFQAAFGTGSGYSSAFAGSGEIEVRAFVPGANPGDSFEDTLVLKPAETVEFADATSYTVINYGTVSDFRSITLIAPVPSTIDTDTIQLQFVHAALGAGSVDVYVTPPGADLASSTATASLTVGDISGFSNEAVEDYQIRLTTPNTTSVIYDSGTISPGTPGNRLFVIGKTTGPGSVPVFLSRWPSQGPPLALGDVNTPAFLRLLHLVSDVGALDLFGEDDYNNPVATNIAFGERSAYSEVRDTLPDGASILEGASIDFSGSATDAEDGDLTASIVWTSSIDGPLADIGGNVSATLGPGTHSVVATVADGANLAGAAAVRVSVITTGNAAPVVEILSPENGREVPDGTPVTFTASANDIEDGDLAASLAWTSSIDGALTGTGASITATLSPGTHAITASVADTGGLPGGESVIVTVTSAGNTPPLVSISAPDLTTFIELDLTLAGDPESIVLQRQYEVFTGAVYTMFASDPADTIGAFVLNDVPQRVATHGLLRIANASDLAGTVDVYVTAAGAGIADASPLFANVATGLGSGTGSIGPGTYDITFTTAGTTVELLVIPSFILEVAQANTIALIDDDATMQVDFLRLTD